MKVAKTRVATGVLLAVIALLVWITSRGTGRDAVPFPQPPARSTFRETTLAKDPSIVRLRVSTHTCASLSDGSLYCWVARPERANDLDGVRAFDIGQHV